MIFKKFSSKKGWVSSDQRDHNSVITPLSFFFYRSNCDPNVRQILRKYYDKPYFIPHDAETGDQDWIFMGGPGPGAPIHVSITWHNLLKSGLQSDLY